MPWPCAFFDYEKYCFVGVLLALCMVGYSYGDGYSERCACVRCFEVAIAKIRYACSVEHAYLILIICVRLLHILFAILGEKSVAFHTLDATEALDGHRPALLGILRAVVV